MFGGLSLASGFLNEKIVFLVFRALIGIGILVFSFLSNITLGSDFFQLRHSQSRPRFILLCIYIPTQRIRARL